MLNICSKLIGHKNLIKTDPWCLQDCEPTPHQSPLLARPARHSQDYQDYHDFHDYHDYHGHRDHHDHPEHLSSSSDLSSPTVRANRLCHQQIRHLHKKSANQTIENQKSEVLLCVQLFCECV